MKLTQKTLPTLVLPAGKSETIIFDEDLPGFGLRIREGGARSWIYQFKLGRRNWRVTLGNAIALSPALARKTAVEMHAQVRLGKDPAGQKLENRDRAIETMAASLQAYLAVQRSRLRPRSYAETDRHLSKHCKPLHNLQLAKIDRRVIATLISAIATHNGLAAANRTRSSLSAFFSWCMGEGLLDLNPVIGTNRQEETSRDRVLSDDELKIIWNATADGSDYSSIVRLLLLTGCRATEIGSLSFSEISDNQITLPPKRTKNGRQHIIPIVPAVQDILNARPRGDGFVFGRRGFTRWSFNKRALDQRIADSGGELAHWVIHDLRRSAATKMAEMGVAPHIVEAILNHVGGHKAGVSGVYNRAGYEPQKRIALQKWTTHVAALISGVPEASSVVKLRA